LGSTTGSNGVRGSAIAIAASSKLSVDDNVIDGGERVVVRFKNTTEMEHAMHLHGHAFSLVETAGTWFARPLLKDVSLVPANGGTATWQFSADSPAGRWLLHCHNDIHMADGMMTEVVYES